jgi:hypothetical protein
MNCHAWIVVGLMAFVAGRTLAAPSHADSFSKEGLLKADVAQLKDTQMIAHPDLPLRAGENALWCGTLQLAWNEAIKLVGEKLQFVRPAQENRLSMGYGEVDLLNQEDFTRADLDADSYVAIADFERNNVEDEIRAALEKTFHGAASPELIPPKPAHPGPYDFVAYAYLYKNLAFAQPFEDNDPMDFGTQSVENFGFLENRKQLSDDVFAQVAIYDYQSPDDFIIKLKTKSPGDELILAKIAPGATLQATIDSALRRMTPDKMETANERDELAIPKLNFDLSNSFTELEGLVLKPGPNARVKNLKTKEVKQLIRFQLNEKGAILKSEAVMIMTNSAMMQSPPKTHVMIFDHPFLILMKRADSARPYFALWVGNASLLVPAKK